MQRRQFNHAALVLLASTVGGPWGRAVAQGAGGLEAEDAQKGIRAALSAGAQVAVNQLGKAGGFLQNPKVRIPLPSVLADVAPLLKAAGQGKRLDALELAMNQAAEQAVPLAADLLQRTIAQLSLADAHRILTGGDTSVTDFFADKTREPLGAQFLPVVKKATEGVQLADKYDAVAGRAAKLGLMKRDDANLNAHVTNKALDGLYAVIADEERKIRQNPAQAGSAVLQKVFGALR